MTLPTNCLLKRILSDPNLTIKKENSATRRVYRSNVCVLPCPYSTWVEFPKLQHRLTQPIGENKSLQCLLQCLSLYLPNHPDLPSSSRFVLWKHKRIVSRRNENPRHVPLHLGNDRQRQKDHKGTGCGWKPTSGFASPASLLSNLPPLGQ